MQKGFTLIELLAVIVILAIIAIITVTIVHGIIEKSRIGAAESSALGYIDAVEKRVMLNKVKGEDEIGEDEYTKVELAAKGVTIKGEITDALVLINKKGKVTKGNFCIDGYSIDYNGKEAKYNKDATYCINIRVYDASEITYTNPLSSNNCQNIACALDELYNEA